MKTKERLARELEKAGAPARIVEKAREGWYDDFESPFSFPTHALVQELRATRMTGMIEFAKRVKGGEFDGTREQAREWAQSREGQGALKGLGRS